MTEHDKPHDEAAIRVRVSFGDPESQQSMRALRDAFTAAGFPNAPGEDGITVIAPSVQAVTAIVDRIVGDRQGSIGRVPAADPGPQWAVADCRLHPWNQNGLRVVHAPTLTMEFVSFDELERERSRDGGAVSGPLDVSRREAAVRVAWRHAHAAFGH